MVGAAIGSGMLVAILMFIRSNSKRPIVKVEDVEAAARRIAGACASAAPSTNRTRP